MSSLFCCYGTGDINKTYSKIKFSVRYVVSLCGFFSLFAKLLGLEIDSELSFTYHVEKLCKKLSQRIGVLNEKIRSCLPTKQRLLYYNTMIRSVLHYVSSIWTSCDKENLSRVFKLQKRAARVISDANKQASSVRLFLK